MSSVDILPAQIKAIHAIKTRVRLEDGSYRAMLSGFGVVSSKDLTRADADKLLARLRDIPGADRPAAARAAGPYAAKLQAMWIALHNLAAVRNGRTEAMHAFLEGQTGVAHTRFLRDHADAARAIEALKAWLIHEGVVWPALAYERDADLVAMKLAILRAQWLRGIQLGAVRAFGPPEACDGLADYASSVLYGAPRRLGAITDPRLTPADLDTVSAAFGKKLRRAKAMQAEVRDAG